jgi:myo-inositol-1(or 4)-monophosphatase
VVDPLDGTTNFLHGIGTFACSVALEDEMGIVAGAIVDPVHEESFHAHRAGGARLNGAPIRCSAAGSLDEALIATGFPFRELHRVGGYLSTLEAFMRSTVGVRRAGSAALDLAHTACGRYDGFWELGLRRWDLAAGVLLVKEAGGIVTGPSGEDGFLDSGDVVAAGPILHLEMIRTTRGRLL